MRGNALEKEHCLWWWGGPDNGQFVYYQFCVEGKTEMQVVKLAEGDIRSSCSVIGHSCMVYPTNSRATGNTKCLLHRLPTLQEKLNQTKIGIIACT